MEEVLQATVLKEIGSLIDFCTWVFDKRKLYRRELNMAISSSSVTKTMYSYLVRHTAICMGKDNF
jgi:hypothetical protein